jgi:hypothetical protein
MEVIGWRQAPIGNGITLEVSWFGGQPLAGRADWPAHTVAKRCENIRNRYVRLGVPGLRGPRALEELAQLLVATGELTPADLRRLLASS